jgi:hypothetical protein
MGQVKPKLCWEVIQDDQVQQAVGEEGQEGRRAPATHVGPTVPGPSLGPTPSKGRAPAFCLSPGLVASVPTRLRTS